LNADKDHNKFLDKQEFLDFFTTIITSTESLPWESGAREASKSATTEDDDDGDDEDEEDEADEIPDQFKDLPPDKQRQAILFESFKSMAIGTILVVLFSDPMVAVLGQIGKATGIPAFYVSFLLAPLASNASELACSYKLAVKKTRGSITQALQALEGAACMNNTFCLSIFLGLMYFQGLAWKFTAETLAILFVQFVIFLVVMLKGSTQSVFFGMIIFLLYPASLILVAGLTAAGLD